MRLGVGEVAVLGGEGVNEGGGLAGISSAGIQVGV